jgi:hypothetical protein
MEKVYTKLCFIPENRDEDTVENERNKDDRYKMKEKGVKKSRNEKERKEKEDGNKICAKRTL